jgi:hypothetical protein
MTPTTQPDPPAMDPEEQITRYAAALEAIAQQFGVDLQVLTELVREVREWPR